MLRVHTIFKDDLERDKSKYGWSDHALNTIKKIIEVWFKSNIAESILLFFKNDLSGDLHSYMPIGLKSIENTPELEDYEGARGQTKIRGVGTYENDFETTHDSFLFQDDDDFVTRTMEENYWSGNELFKLMKKKTVLSATQHLSAGTIIGNRGQYRRQYRGQYRRQYGTQEAQLLENRSRITRLLEKLSRKKLSRKTRSRITRLIEKLLRKNRLLRNRWRNETSANEVTTNEITTDETT